MNNLIEHSLDILKGLQKGSSQQPSRIVIARDHLDDLTGLPPKLIADNHYFEVRVNEIFLSNNREWFKTFDPMAVAVTEFSYAQQTIELPFVVGPSLLDKSGTKLPLGMVFANTRIAGPRPYKGGQLAISLILYKLQRDDMLRKLLDVVGNMVGVLNPGLALTTSLKIAGMVLDNLDALTGSNGSATPVIGIRDEFSPVTPGYFALIDQPNLNPDNLWVKDKRLHHGSSLKEAEPFRGADYQLFSITQTEMEDISQLPFYPTYQHVLEEADKSASEDIWKSAKANMAALLGMLDTSPDLTNAHAARLGDEWINTIKTLHKRATKLSNLGPADEAEIAKKISALDQIRAKTIDVLDM